MCSIVSLFNNPLGDLFEIRPDIEISWPVQHVHQDQVQVNSDQAGLRWWWKPQGTSSLLTARTAGCECLATMGSSCVMSSLVLPLGGPVGRCWTKEPKTFLFSISRASLPWPSTESSDHHLSSPRLTFCVWFSEQNCFLYFLIFLAKTLKVLMNYFPSDF